MPKVTPEHKAAVRGRLIAAAADCLLEDQWERLTIRAILARAALSPGALYTYFASKDELVAAVTEHLLEHDRDSLEGAATDTDSLAERVAAQVARLFRAEKRASIVPAMRARARREPEIRDGLQRYDEKLASLIVPLIEELQAQGSVPVDIDPARLHDAVCVFFEGLEARRGPGSEPAPNHDAIAQLFLRMLNVSLGGETPFARALDAYLIQTVGS